MKTAPIDELMTKQEKAFLLKAIWTSLQAPDWDKDDLVDFGKAIFTKTQLKDLNEAAFGKFLKYMTQITDKLGLLLAEHSRATIEEIEKKEKEARATATAEVPTEKKPEESTTQSEQP